MPAHSRKAKTMPAHQNNTTTELKNAKTCHVIPIDNTENEKGTQSKDIASTISFTINNCLYSNYPC